MDNFHFNYAFKVEYMHGDYELYKYKDNTLMCKTEIPKLWYALEKIHYLLVRITNFEEAMVFLQKLADFVKKITNHLPYNSNDIFGCFFINKSEQEYCKEYVKRTAVYRGNDIIGHFKNLHCATSGTMPENPEEILLRLKMVEGSCEILVNIHEEYIRQVFVIPLGFCMHMKNNVHYIPMHARPDEFRTVAEGIPLPVYDPWPQIMRDKEKQRKKRAMDRVRTSNQSCIKQTRKRKLPMYDASSPENKVQKFNF